MLLLPFMTSNKAFNEFLGQGTPRPEYKTVQEKTGNEAFIYMVSYNLQ